MKYAVAPEPLHSIYSYLFYPSHALIVRGVSLSSLRGLVVVHPDYRGDCLGVLAVKITLGWIKERRVPEMKKKKHIVETIAQMARYNSFFEKAGFYYMWETVSGRPVLMYPLTDEARKKIEKFL